MRKALKISGISASVLVQVLLFILAVLLISFASYVVGYPYLSGNNLINGNTLMGNDAYSFFTIVVWISKFFPNVPFWFPLQGGGVSFNGYPWFAAYIINVISHFTPLNLVQSFRLLGFISVPLTGLGIFVFVWTRLTDVRPVWLRQILGLIASLFYVIAPIAWMWLVRWGFYAESVSYLFIPWTLIFFDIFLERLFRSQKDFLYRLSIVLSLLLWFLAFSTHFNAGVNLLGLLGILFIVYILDSKENKFSLLKRVLPAIIFFGLVFALIFGSRYFSYSYYMDQVAIGGFSGYTVNPTYQQVQASILSPKLLLSLTTVPWTDPRYGTEDLTFPFYVWIPVLISLLFSYFKSKKIFVFSLVVLIGFCLNAFVGVQALALKIPFFSLFFNGRSAMIFLRILVPVVSAYGAYLLWEMILAKIIGNFKTSGINHYLRYSVKTVLVCLLTVATVGFLFYQFYNLPYSRSVINAGAIEFPIIDSSGNSYQAKINIRDIWGKNLRQLAVFTANYSPQESEFLGNNPSYNVADYMYLNYLCNYGGSSNQITSVIYPAGHICSYYQYRQLHNRVIAKQSSISIFPPLDMVKNAQTSCIGLSVSQYTGLFRYCYAFYSPSLFDQLAVKNWPPFVISPSISGEQAILNNFFSPLPKNTGYRYDISGYSGDIISAAALGNPNSQIELYINTLSLIYNSWNYFSTTMYTNYFPVGNGLLSELARWFGINYANLALAPQPVINNFQRDNNWQKLDDTSWEQFKPSVGLVSWDTRPRVLVIADNSRTLYDDTFKEFTKGALLYDQAIPVMGGKSVDSYSLDYLKQFQAIYMRGYSYNSQNGAYQLLDNYVKSGGNLIFDTGWQYNVPDYQLSSAPSFMPFNSLSWQNLPTSGTFRINDASIAGPVDVGKFGPLTYEDGSWGVSVPASVSGWGKTVLSYDNSPLIVAGQYGQGKVVWIGFNLMAHEETKDSPEELRLFNNLMVYLLGGFKGNAEKNVTETGNLSTSPDKLEFDFNDVLPVGSNLYFREAYFPYWKAEFVSPQGSQDVPVMRAGPGFMFMVLPQVQSGDKVILQIKESLLQDILNITSVITLICLFIYLFFPGVVYGVEKYLSGFNLTPKIKIKMPEFIGSMSSDEENY